MSFYSWPTFLHDVRRFADCERCRREAGEKFRDYMIVCKTCGNKRCPKASDHRLACTGSNAPGQPGSVY